MNTEQTMLAKMLQGFPSLDTFVANLSLATSQKIKLSLYKAVISFYQKWVLPLRRRRARRFQAELERLKELTIHIPDHGLTPNADNDYLSQAAIRSFEESGILGPFPVISPSYATILKKDAMRAHANDFNGNIFIGKEAMEAFKKHKDWNLNKSGTYQALQLRQFRGLLRKPAIAHRLASILGPDVICWRSQFEEKKPGDLGTFWHQNSAFQEYSKARKLTPTEPIPTPIIQLTVYVALTDITIENGAMRMIPNSFRDGRLERFYEFAASNPLDFIARLDEKQIDMALKASLKSANEVTKSQAVFHAALDQFKECFEGKEVKNLTMKAGEAVIFTSLNMHASYPNTTQDDTCLAFIGRCTANSVKVYEGMDEDIFPTPEGNKRFSTAPISSIQIHGEDRYGFNRILDEAKTA